MASTGGGGGGGSTGDGRGGGETTVVHVPLEDMSSSATTATEQNDGGHPDLQRVNKRPNSKTGVSDANYVARGHHYSPQCQAEETFINEGNDSDQLQPLKPADTDSELIQNSSSSSGNKRHNLNTSLPQKCSPVTAGVRSRRKLNDGNASTKIPDSEYGGTGNAQQSPAMSEEEQTEGFRQKVLAAQKQRQTAVGEFIVHDKLPPPENDRFFRLVNSAQTRVYAWWAKYKTYFQRVAITAIVLAYLVYLGFAIHYSVKGAAALITLTVLAFLYVLKTRLLERHCTKCQKWIARIIFNCTLGRPRVILKWCALGTVAVGILAFLILDVGADRGRLTSAAGVLIFLFIGFITSKDPARIRWQPVLWGLGLQVTLGVIILRWQKGYLAFKFLGELVRGFLEYTDEGSKFVFGEQGLILHPVAFKVFPIVIFFSSVIAIMYYWGIMQMIVCRIAWLMQFTMGTTAIESLNAATNIFIGMAESVVVVAPYMNKLTKSELHAVMTGGFATVAGSYMAVLIQVGASPEHLLSAAIMSAPAALAMAKLSYPETEVSITKTEEDVYIEKCQERNVVEAAARGAMGAIAVVASILVNLIAFIALMAFLDAILSYAGARIGYPELSFQLICSYVLWPLAAVMGVEIEDAGKVARLLGVKVFVDEFISFRDLGIMVKAGTIHDRSVVIATYACCGFGSVAAVGTYVGALAAVAPDRRGDISELAFRAAVNGNVAGFLTACIAGVLYKGDMTMNTLASDFMNTTVTNTTADYLVL